MAKSSLYALLVSIDDYDDYDDRSVNGIRYPKMGSAVRDIEHVHAFLCDYLRVPDARVITLTATLSGGEHGASPPSSIRAA